MNNLIDKDGVLNELMQSINSNFKLSVFGCSMNEKLWISTNSGKFTLYITPNISRATELKQRLDETNLNGQVIDKMQDFCYSPFNEYTTHFEIINKLISNEYDYLIITASVLNNIYPERQYFEQNNIKYEVGDSFDFDNFIQILTNNNYTRQDNAVAKGEYSIRGEVIDICPFIGCPTRLIIDFDTIEHIKEYDQSTLMSVKNIESFSLTNNDILEFEDDIIEYDNQDYYGVKNTYFSFAFIKNKTTNILNLIPKNSLIVLDDIKGIHYEYNESVLSFNNAILQNIKNEKLVNKHKNFIIDNKINFNLINHTLLAFHSITNNNLMFNPNKVFNIKCGHIANYSKNQKLLLEDLQLHNKNKDTVILYLKSVELTNKYSQLFDKQKITYNICNTKANIQKQTINLIAKQSSISSAFLQEKLFIISTNDLIQKTTISTISADNVVDFDGFLPKSGDIVVHKIHGVGRCLGVENISFNNIDKEYILIEYKNNDKLYLPVENIDSISKFIGAHNVPSLNKLGGNDFEKTKTKVRNSLKQMAIDLVDLYKQRQNAVGYKYVIDEYLESEFQKSFGFVETPDQAKSIQEIKNEMTQGKVIDRLICGDVGYGKTEVALRVIFDTIMNGKQVAFLCPTTILSQQHYSTLVHRMKNFGIKIEVLNRFKTPKQVKEIYDKIEKGQVDIVVGTHKILSKQIVFKNLGLLVLDEEQKFGVEDKEKIKEIKNQINVITLSATPIPRTLHMSMVGIRDISVINTPPTQRLNTFVQVLEYDSQVVKSAIDKEISRGGQVLVVYNRVESIHAFTSQLKTLISPDYKVGIAHGQMSQKELEDQIFKLYNKEFDVLVATTLIENGIDLPTANTLIVIDSDRLGLSQLYQLKGRVGRSDIQAYAYFTYMQNKLLSEDAYKRLQAISEFASLGSGYKIALRDLEIRGAGNVLGKEQSGHLAKVGYWLYMNLLDQAVKKVKGEKVREFKEVKINSEISLSIPNDLKLSYDHKIMIYTKIGKITNISEYNDVIEQLKSMINPLSQQIINICKISLIKNLAFEYGAISVTLKTNGSYIQFDSEQDVIDMQQKIQAFDDICDVYENYPKQLHFLGESLQNDIDLMIKFLTFSNN